MTGKFILVLMIFCYPYVEGAIQLHAVSEPTLAGFQLECDVSPDAISDSVLFYNPQGINVGGCNIVFTCGSAASNIITQDRSINSTYITIIDANVVDESSVKGEWRCTHNGETATLEVTELLCNSSLEKPVNVQSINTDEFEVEFTHNCVCPDSSYVVQYVPEGYPNETGVLQRIPDAQITLSNDVPLPSCRNNGSKTITGKFKVGNDRPTENSRIKVTAQILGALTGYKPISVSDFTVEGKKIDQCVCAVTTILGGVLGIPFTILFDAVFIFGIYVAKDKEIIKKFKEKKVLTIMAVGIGVLVSCGLGAGVTAAVMSGKDTGYESTGCKCMKYIGVVVSLGFSILVSVVTSAIIYLFVFSRKDAGTVCDGLIFGECFDKVKKTCTCAVTPERKSPEGKEANNSVNENEMLPTKTDDDEKPSDHVAPQEHSLLDKVRINRPLPAGRNPAVFLPGVEKGNNELYDNDAIDFNDDAPKKSKRRKKKKVQATDNSKEIKDPVGDENEAETNVKKLKKKRKKNRNVLKDPDVSEPNYEEH